MLLQLATFSIVLVALIGLGAGAFTIARACGPRRAFSPETFDLAWLGLAVMIAVLMAWSLFGAIGDACAVTLGVAAAMGLVPSRRWLVRALHVRALLASVLALGIAIAIAWGANAPVSFGDSRASHLQQVMWARDYGAVIGLGNLSIKFALDQSVHLFAALLDRGPFRDASLRVAVPFILWLTLAQWMWTCVRVPRTDGDVRARLFCALTLPWLVAKARGFELASLSGDVPLGCAALAMMHVLVRLPFVPRTQLRRMAMRHAYSIWIAGVLGTLIATLKASGVVLTLVGVAGFLIAAAPLGVRWLVVGASLPAALVAGVVARRVVLAGWLLFPAPLGNLHVPWSIPEALVTDEYRYIRAWARIEMRPTDDVLDHGFWHWFTPWFERFRHSQEAYVLVLALVLLLARAASRRAWSFIEALTIATAGASIAYWFLAAPDLRFGGVFVWMLLGVAALPMLAAADRRRVALAIVLTAVAIRELVLPTPPTWNVQRRPPSWTRVTAVDAHYVTDAVSIPAPTGPLVLNVPRWGRMFCGDTPLPCTPFPRTQRLRVPGRLGSGFLP